MTTEELKELIQLDSTSELTLERIKQALIAINDSGGSGGGGLPAQDFLIFGSEGIIFYRSENIIDGKSEWVGEPEPGEVFNVYWEAATTTWYLAQNGTVIASILDPSDNPYPISGNWGFSDYVVVYPFLAENGFIESSALLAVQGMNSTNITYNSGNPNFTANDVSTAITDLVNIKNYLLWTTLLTQVGTNEPESYVIYDAFNEDFVYTYLSKGRYKVSSNSRFNPIRTSIIFNNVLAEGGHIFVDPDDITENDFIIQTMAMDGALKDDILKRTEMQIKVYFY